MLDVTKIHWAIVHPWQAFSGTVRGPLYSTKRAAILDSVEWVSSHGWAGKTDDIMAKRNPHWWCLVGRHMLLDEFFKPNPANLH